MDERVIQNALGKISQVAQQIKQSAYNVFSPQPQPLRQPEGNMVATKWGNIPFKGPDSGTVLASNTAPTPQPTVMPSPTPAPVANDPNFRFAFDTLQRDPEWSAHGPRPNFTPKQPPADVGNIIREIFPNEATVAAAVAGSENGKYTSGKDADNVWNKDGSIDRGIFAINSNTFNGLMSRQGDKLRKLGITSFEDMHDPRKNAIVAKMIREGARDYRPETNPEGWGGWFGWQDVGYELNKGYYTKGDRVEHELKQKKARNKK